MALPTISPNRCRRPGFVCKGRGRVRWTYEVKGAIKRRRECEVCGYRWTTEERPEERKNSRI